LEKLDEQLLINPEQLAILVRSHKVDDEIKLAVIHDGKATTLSVKLVEHDLAPLKEIGENEEAQEFWRMLPEPRLRPIAPGQRPDWIHPGGPANATASSMTWIEADRFYTIVNKDGHRTFTVKDKEGKTLFDGPIDTKDQRDKLAPELKDKLEKLQQHMPGTTLKSLIPKSTTQPAGSER
jgi:hypothetical protein